MSNYGRYGSTGYNFFPPVIKALLIANGVVFFLQLIGQSVRVGQKDLELYIMQWFSLLPIDGLNVMRGNGSVEHWSFMPWQLITYQFLHSTQSFSHILFNMFGLWMFGAEIEYNFGSKKFLIYYLICGISGGVLHLLFSFFNGGGAPTIGASGAVYGVMIAFALMFPNRYIFIYFLIPVKAKYLIGFMIIMEFLLVDSNMSSGVAHLAHLGGVIAGFLFIMLDKSIMVDLKSAFRRFNYNRKTQQYNYTTSKKNNVEEATFYDITDETKISQEEIDKILDKISMSGYQNLTEREKRILMEASRKMK